MEQDSAMAPCCAQPVTVRLGWAVVCTGGWSGTCLHQPDSLRLCILAQGCTRWCARVWLWQTRFEVLSMQEQKAACARREAAEKGVDNGATYNL